MNKNVVYPYRGILLTYKDQALTRTTTWKNLENIMPSAFPDSKATYYMTPFV